MEGSCPFSLFPAGPSCPGRPFPSFLHGKRPIPVLKELPQALQVDRRKVGADPLADPPLPLAGVLPPGLAELVPEVFPPDPPVGDKDSSSGLGVTSGKRLGSRFYSIWIEVLEPFWMERAARGGAGWLHMPALHPSIHPFIHPSILGMPTGSSDTGKALGSSQAPLDALWDLDVPRERRTGRAALTP